MINEIVPFVKIIVEDDASGESFRIVVGDLPACFVDFVDNSGKHFQSGLGHGVGGSLAGISHGKQRYPAPGSGYLGEEAVLDGVVLGAVWRVMHHDNPHADSVGEAYEILLHDMVGAGVGAASVTENHENPRIGIEGAEMVVPAVLDVVAHKLGSVVASADGEVSSVVGDVVDAVWHYSPFGERGEVVVEGLGRRCAEHSPLSFEVADKLFLLRVDTDNRNAVLHTHLPDTTDFLKLLVPALDLAHGYVLAERPRLESVLPDKPAHMVFGDFDTPPEERFSYIRCLDIEPHGVLILRVASHMLAHYIHKTLLPFRMLCNFILGTAASLAHSARFDALRGSDFTNSLAYRPCRDSERRAQWLYRKTIVPDRLARNKMSSLPFIKRHKERKFFFFEPYWGFLLQSCNYLCFNYKDTKIFPVINCLKC